MEEPLHVKEKKHFSLVAPRDESCQDARAKVFT